LPNAAPDRPRTRGGSGDRRPADPRPRPLTARPSRPVRSRL